MQKAAQGNYEVIVPVAVQKIGGCGALGQGLVLTLEGSGLWFDLMIPEVFPNRDDSVNTEHRLNKYERAVQC